MECVYTGNLVEIYKVSPRLYFRNANLPVRGQCNSAFVVLGGEVGLVDPSTQEAASEIKEEIRQLFDKPLKYIFLTHNHYDHADGLKAFMDEPVTIFCSHKCAGEIAGTERRAAVVAGVRDRLTLHLDGGRIELFALDDTAHSPYDMLVRFPEESAVCTGDFVVEFDSLYFHQCNPELWVTALRELGQGPDRYILPGHGGVLPASRFGETADYITLLRKAGLECLSALYPTGPFFVPDIDGAAMDRKAAEYLAGQSPEAAAIISRAGGDAQRELRTMVSVLHCRRVM